MDDYPDIRINGMGSGIEIPVGDPIRDTTRVGDEITVRGQRYTVTQIQSLLKRTDGRYETAPVAFILRGYEAR